MTVLKNCKCGNKLEKGKKFCSYRCTIIYRNLKVNDCWEWQGKLNTSGYGQLSMRGNNKKQVIAHRISYLEFKGEIPTGMVVCHSCDNKKCVNPEHLWLGTPKDNFRDSMKKGRMVFRGAIGTEHINAKLDDEKVKEILERIKRKENIKEIAKIYGIHYQTIYQIKYGKAWGHVPRG
jgi:hypothetical protein